MRAPYLFALLAAVSIAFSPVLPADDKRPAPDKLSPPKTKPSLATMASSAPLGSLPQRLRDLNDALTVRIKGKLDADATRAIAELHQIQNMTVPLCPKPRIDSIFPFSNFTPGGTVLIKGCGFGKDQQYLGSGPSTFVLTLSTGQDIPLAGLQWSNNGIAGTLPGLENGILRAARTQPATLVVTTPLGSARSAPVTYRAGHFIQAYPFDRLVIGVGQQANDNSCNSWGHDGLGHDGIMGICSHYLSFWRWDNHLDGKDTFTIDLKNGWTVDSWIFTNGNCCIDQNGLPNHHGQGQSHWTFTINWFIPCHDYCPLWYYIEVFVEGEIGTLPW